MTFPVYVLLPEGVDWIDVPDTAAQGAKPIRWYTRQSMPDATTQTAVLVPGEGVVLDQRVAAVVRQAEQLGGVAVDASSQQVIAPGVPAGS